MLYGSVDTQLNIGGNTYPLIQPALDLDFTNRTTLDSRITFTRGSSATFTDKDGYIKYVTNNIPRFDYDPVLGQCNGLLMEEQRTNLLTYTSNFENWVTDYAYVSLNSTLAPDGTYSGYKLNSTANTSIGANHGLINQVTPVASLSTYYTFSIYLKQGTSPTSLFDFYQTNPYREIKTLITWSNPPSVATATGNGGIIFANTFTSVGGGWYRCSMTLKSDANTASACVCRVYTLEIFKKVLSRSINTVKITKNRLPLLKTFSLREFINFV